MKLISLGNVHFKLVYILFGGLAKLVAELILYFFADKIKMNTYPFIMGINAGLGMTLAFIPDLILKCKLGNKITKKDEKILYNNFEFNTRKKRISKTQLKIIIIALCCILDYIQKILTFLYSQYILNNLWIFDIVFLGAFSWLILNLKLYNHQYLSCLFMIIFGIVLNAIDVEYDVSLIYKLLLSFLIEICYNLAIVVAKYGMDTLFMTPFEITCYEGIFEVVLNVIFLAIATNKELVNPPLLIELAKSCEYKGKTYLDNFYSYWESMDGTEVLVFIVQMFSRALFNLFGHIIANEFTPSHVIFLLMIGEIFLAFKGTFDTKHIGSLFIILVEIFMLLIFTEIIELNFCELEYNTKKNIRERERKITALDSKSDDSGDVGGDIQLKEIIEEGGANTSYDLSNSHSSA